MPTSRRGARIEKSLQAVDLIGAFAHITR
jgi:hypothetical protein